MDAKEYLIQLKNIDNLIKALDEAERTAELMTTPSGVKLSDVPAYPSGYISDKTGDVAIRIEELKKELKVHKEKYVNVKLTATKYINQLLDIRHQTVLYWYYLQNRTLEDTAENMQRSYQNICTLHKQALKEFQAIMDKKRGK